MSVPLQVISFKLATCVWYWRKRERNILLVISVGETTGRVLWLTVHKDTWLSPRVCVCVCVWGG